jgi:hypothetical protein
VDSALQFLVWKRPDEAERQVLLDSARAVLNNRSRWAAILLHVELIRDEGVARRTRELADQMASLGAGTMALVFQSAAQNTLAEEQVRALEWEAKRFVRLGLELTWAAGMLDAHRTDDADIDPERVASSAVVGEEPWRPFTRYILWVCMVREWEMPTASEFAALALIAGLEQPTKSDLRSSREKLWAARKRTILKALPAWEDFNPWTHRPRGT